MSTNIDKLQVRHSLALQDESAANSELEAAELAFEAELARTMEANEELKRLKEQLDKKKTAATEAKEEVKTCRAEAKTFLEQRFIDNLPEGYKQNKGKKVTYNERMLFMAALQYMPNLLKIDDKAVQDLAKLAAERSVGGEKKLALPERIGWVIPVKLITVPKPQISDATLKKFKPVDEPVVEEEVQPEPVTVATTPRMIDTTPKKKSDDKPEVNLVPPTHEINC